MKPKMNISQTRYRNAVSGEMAECQMVRHASRVVLVAIVVILTMVVVPSTNAQTYTVLHTFNDGGDDEVGLTIDRAGDLYGTTTLNGNDCPWYSCGTVFRLQKRGSNWLFNTLYKFQPTTGFSPSSRVSIGPDGSLFGVTQYGGGGPCYLFQDGDRIRVGCGTVYRLRPFPEPCVTALCPWSETTVHTFQGGIVDGSFPMGDLAFDSEGNIYGTTYAGPIDGSVYELTPAGGSWNESVLYSFTGGSDGAAPILGVVRDSSGNLYGSTDGSCGGVFQLAPSGSGWTETTLNTFTSPEGCGPGGLVFDPAGNLYGMTAAGGSAGGGTVFQLALTGVGRNLNVLYNFPGNPGPINSLTRDANGNLYGVLDGGLYGYGLVFRLSPILGGWTFTDLHDFSGTDGAYPSGAVVLDAQGNLYGSTSNVIWEITP